MPDFTPEQEIAARALRKAVLRAQGAGLYLVADASTSCLRLATKDHARGLDDLSAIQRTIPVDDGCGGLSAGSRHPDWGNA